MAPLISRRRMAFDYVEIFNWADGKVCPHCGGLDRLTKIIANPVKHIRVGLWCFDDRKQRFTVKTGTMFEHRRLKIQNRNQQLTSKFMDSLDES